jgi:hypothetical protein
MSVTGIIGNFSLYTNSFGNLVLVDFEFGIYNYVSKRRK